MAYVPCRERTFPLRLRPLFRRVHGGYSHWLKHLVERLGPAETQLTWRSAFRRYDLPLLESILASGWLEVSGAESETDSDDAAIELEEIFAGDTEGVSVPEARAVVEATPPIPQVRSGFADLDVQRETTAFEALHLYAHGTALLAESLIERHGKEGELMAYDLVRARRMSSVGAGGGTVAEFMEMLGPAQDEPDIFSAGLEVEVVRVTPKEHVFLVKECEWARYFREKHTTVGYLVACSTDEAFARAFNDSLRLQRTSTLMEGGDVCDFRFYVVEEKPEI